MIGKRWRLARLDVLLWGLCNWVENPNTNCSEACEDAIIICHNKDYKTFPFCHCLSLIHWYLCKNRLLLFQLCMCASYYMCVFICSAQCINLHQQQIQAHQKDTQRLCMRNVSRVYGGGIKHMCSEDPLSTTYIPRLQNTGAVYRNKYNRRKPVCRCRFTRCCCCVSMQQGSV